MGADLSLLTLAIKSTPFAVLGLIVINAVQVYMIRDMRINIRDIKDGVVSNDKFDAIIEALRDRIARLETRMNGK